MVYKCKIFEAVNWTPHVDYYFVYVDVCKISKDININNEKEICLPYKESISGYRCEKTNMTAKYEMFMNSSKKS